MPVPDTAPNGPKPHLTLNAERGHLIGEVTIGSVRFAVEVERDEKGYLVHWLPHAGAVPTDENVYRVWEDGTL